MTPPVYLPILAASGAGRLQGDWAAEPKLDGWRAIVTVDPSLPVGFEVRSRTGRFITTHVPEFAGLAELGFRMVLDGIDCTQLPYRDRSRVREMLELCGPSRCTVPRFPFHEAEALFDACVRLRQEGTV